MRNFKNFKELETEKLENLFINNSEIGKVFINVCNFSEIKKGKMN